MIGWIKRLFAPWEYVGTVDVGTQITKDGENIPGFYYQGYYILRQHPIWGRRAKKIGDGGHSRYAIRQIAMVNIWLTGGPLPNRGFQRAPTSPLPFVVIKGGKK